MAERIKRFFENWEAVWEAIPDYVKIFLYSASSVLIGMYLSDTEISMKTIVTIVATNIGLYQIPREGTKQIKKIL